jgi:hypothetical protein
VADEAPGLYAAPDRIGSRRNPFGFRHEPVRQPGRFVRHRRLGRRGVRHPWRGIARSVDRQPDQLAPDRQRHADLAPQCDDDAGHGRWNFDRGLVGHDVGQDLVFGDGVAGLHAPGDNLDFGDAFAEVGHLDDVNALANRVFGRHAPPSIVRLNAAPTRSGPGKYAHSCAWG